MNGYVEGEKTGRGWRAKKFYLSDEAAALLKAHCEGTPLTMSACIDQLVKDKLGPPALPIVPLLREVMQPDIFTDYELKHRDEEKRALLGEREAAQPDIFTDYERAIDTQDFVQLSHLLPVATETAVQTSSPATRLAAEQQPPPAPKRRARPKEQQPATTDSKKDFDLDI